MWATPFGDPTCFIDRHHPLTNTLSLMVGMHSHFQSYVISSHGGVCVASYTLPLSSVLHGPLVSNLRKLHNWSITFFLFFFWVMVFFFPLSWPKKGMIDWCWPRVWRSLSSQFTGREFFNFSVYHRSTTNRVKSALQWNCQAGHMSFFSIRV